MRRQYEPRAFELILVTPSAEPRVGSARPEIVGAP